MNKIMKKFSYYPNFENISQGLIGSKKNHGKEEGKLFIFNNVLSLSFVYLNMLFYYFILFFTSLLTTYLLLTTTTTTTLLLNPVNLLAKKVFFDENFLTFMCKKVFFEGNIYGVNDVLWVVLY